MITKESRQAVRGRRHIRIRGRVSGTGERPRLVVFRSSKHIYAQVIDDVEGKTLVAASTMDPDLRKSLSNGATVDAAEKVGELVAERAKSKGIVKVVYDRGGNLYHGRVAALAEGARKGGLEF